MRKTKDSISQETSSKIETNAKNEIKELLDEFVVQPIKSDLPSTFEGINDAIDGIRKETKLIKDSMPNTFTIAEDIKTRFEKDSFIFEDKETVFNSITDKVDSTKNEIAKSQRELISEKTTEITDKIGEAMRHQSLTEEEIKLLREKIVYQQDLIEGVTDKVSDTESKVVEAIKKQNNDVSTNLSEIAKSQRELISERTLEITDKICEVMRRQSSTDEVIKLLYEKVIYQQSLIEGQNKIINDFATTLVDLKRVLEQLDNRISANKRDIRSLSNRFWKRK